MPVKVFVVSLSRASERREFMSAQLCKLGLSFEFIEACDARNITDADVRNVNSLRLYPNELTRGEIACARSHAKACEALSKEKCCEYGLIIEDDVLLGTKVPTILKELETLNLGDSLTLLTSLVFKPVTFFNQLNLKSGYKLVIPDNVEGMFGTQAYFLSKKKAGELSRDILPVRTIADDWKFYLENNYLSDIKLVYPFSVLHAEFLSAVNEKRMINNINLRTRCKNYIYYNKIFPFYQIFLWIRRNKAEKIQRKNILVPDLKHNKTYKL